MLTIEAANYLKEKLGTGLDDDVFLVIDSLEDDESITVGLTTFKANYNIIINEKKGGTLNREEFIVNRNRITKSLEEIIDDNTNYQTVKLFVYVEDENTLRLNGKNKNILRRYSAKKEEWKPFYNSAGITQFHSDLHNKGYQLELVFINGSYPNTNEILDNLETSFVIFDFFSLDTTNVKIARYFDNKYQNIYIPKCSKVCSLKNSIIRYYGMITSKVFTTLTDFKNTLKGLECGMSLELAEETLLKNRLIMTYDTKYKDYKKRIVRTTTGTALDNLKSGF